jgi:hypothetical protein
VVNSSVEAFGNLNEILPAARLAKLFGGSKVKLGAPGYLAARNAAPPAK